MSIAKTILLWLFISTSLGLTVYPGWANDLPATGGALLVWGEQDDRGKYAISFSQQSSNGWSPAIPLGNGLHEEILPTVTADSQNNVWVAWTELVGVHGTVWYRLRTGKTWGMPTPLATPTSSDLAPSLTVDAAGVAWLVYSGSDGVQDDIYAVRWLPEGKWSRPDKIHPDNLTPDILPELSLGPTGNPRVLWQGFDGNQYKTCSTQWTGSHWSTGKSASNSSSSHFPHNCSNGSAEVEDTVMTNLPDFVKDTSQADMHIFTSQAATTIRLREK